MFGVLLCTDGPHGRIDSPPRIFTVCLCRGAHLSLSNPCAWRQRFSRPSFSLPAASRSPLKTRRGRVASSSSCSSSPRFQFGRSSSPSGRVIRHAQRRREQFLELFPARPPAAAHLHRARALTRSAGFSSQGRLPGTHFPTPRLCGSRRHVSRPLDIAQKISSSQIARGHHGDGAGREPSRRDCRTAAATSRSSITPRLGAEQPETARR